MRANRFIMGTVLTAAAAACVARPGTLDRSLAPGAQWTAVLVPAEGSSLRGSFTFVRTDPPGQTRVIISLAGGVPGGIHPWHVHYGRCGDDGVIVGTPGGYPPLVLGSAGTLDAVAQLPIALAERERYFVHVHASPTDMKTVAACGALVRDRGLATTSR